MKAHSKCASRAGLPKLAERLRHDSRKVTGPRQAIFEVLGRKRHPLSARAILEALEGYDCDLATIYRSLHLLEGLRMVKRFDLGDGVARFELLKEGDDGHHHHLVCTRCAGVVEVDECFSADLERKIAAESGFKAVTHKLEFFGICPSCQ
jgi:Fur family ferric uptake transcriptional regulator